MSTVVIVSQTFAVAFSDLIAVGQLVAIVVSGKFALLLQIPCVLIDWLFVN